MPLSLVKAAFQDFDPFWEFVSGPLDAGAFGPSVLDLTTRLRDYSGKVLYTVTLPAQH